MSAMHHSRRLFHSRFISSTASFIPRQTLLVLGCNGSLGSSIISNLRQQQGDGTHTSMVIVGADLHPPRDTVFPPVDSFIQLEKGSPEQIIDCLSRGFHKAFETKPVFDVVICANGGFATDENPISDELVAMNYNPVEAISSDVMLPFISSQDALLVAFGATVAAKHQVDDDSKMIKYIASKKLVHDRIQMLGSITGKALCPSKKLHDIILRRQYPCLHKLTAFAILPSTLDTETNRKLMKPTDQDLQSWTKMDDLSEEISKWIMMKELRPSSGSLIKCVTENGLTEFIISR